MRRLKRNQRPFKYCLLLGYVDGTDSDGYKTGHKVKSYATPVKCSGCISYTGKSKWKPYGTEENYSVEIIPNEPIPVTLETKILIGEETYYVVANKTSKNEQVIFAK